MGCIRKNLSEHNCAVGPKQRLKKIRVHRPGHQPEKIDSYGINKPDVKGIVYLEVVSKPQIRFKGKAQADRESAAYMGVCEHLLEVCNAAIGP